MPVTPSYPSAALALYSLLNSVRPEDIRYGEESIDLPTVSIPIEKMHSKASEASEILFPLKFHRAATGPEHEPREGTYPVISYTELIEPTEDVKKMLVGSIVIIGENTSGPDDVVDTSVGQMKGFEAHAQCLDRLLNHDFFTLASEQAALPSSLLDNGIGCRIGLADLATSRVALGRVHNPYGLHGSQPLVIRGASFRVGTRRSRPWIPNRPSQPDPGAGHSSLPFLV